ncbi:BBSome complex assembly protein BBS10 [Amia ocellicauda]|uniref:BBSome complex assembly protein BBS10 n=1 Tax=Amia ocellicauda TaxID=2972642 RepID=UPI003463A63A
MKDVQSLGIGTLVQIAETLESIVGRCFGPHGGQVLFTKATGEVLLTRDGKQIFTSLLLDHPVARVLVDCISVHCSVTGDGAKSFILLLSALLRGLQASVGKGTAGQTTCHRSLNRGKQVSHELRRVANCLLTFQTHVLEGIIQQHLGQHVTSLFSHDGRTTGKDKLQSIMEAYFCGKTGRAHCRLLSALACDYYFKCNCEGNRVGALSLICEHFSELHTTVTGLPVSSSQILEGLVLHRDFTVHCPTDGQLNIVVVTEPIQPSFSASGTTLHLGSDSQLQSCYSWISDRVEEMMNSLHQSQVKLLLSSVKQSDLVLSYAKLRGISVVECIEEDELALFCSCSGASPLASSSDVLQVRQEQLAGAEFCRPVLLGSHRYAHVRLLPQTVFAPHCLVLCGTVPGLSEQYVSAFHGAFCMLRRTCEPVDSRNLQGVFSNAPATAHVKGTHETLTNRSVKTTLEVVAVDDTNTDCPDPRCPVVEDLHSGCDSVDDEKQGGGPMTGDQRTFQEWLVDDKRNQLGSQSSSSNSHCCSVSDPDPPQSGFTCAVSNEHMVKRNSVCLINPVNVVLVNQCRVCFSDVAPGSSSRPGQSESLVEAGSMLPVGGSFEFLLQHYLKLYSTQSLHPDTKTACDLLAEAVLNIPRTIYRGKGTNRRFLQVYTEFKNEIQRKAQRKEGPVLYESVSCKYQLLLSVLQCLRTLVAADFLIHVGEKTLTVTERDSEDSDSFC